jgi:Family of unknown function (DUF5681)
MDDNMDIGAIAEVVPVDEGSDVARKLAPRGRPFAKGTVANPRGRPVGSRNKSTLLAQAYFDEMAKEITAKALTMAMSGDPVALRLCLERILPRRRDTAVRIEGLPEVETAADCKTAVKEIIRAAAAGEISPGEAQAFINMIGAQTRLMTALLGDVKGRTPH